MAFALISAFIFLVIAYMMRKRISYLEMYTTTLFSTVFQLNVDIILDLKYGFYGYFDKGVDYHTFIFIFLIYPPLNLIFINYFPFKRKIVFQSMYIVAWIIFAIIYEYFCVQAGAFYYNWNLGYSAMIYPFVFVLLILNFLFIKKILLLDKK